VPPGTAARAIIAAMEGLVVAVDDPRAPDVRALLERHLDFCRSCSHPEDVHALDLEGLTDPAVTLFGARSNGELLGVGALKAISGDHAELKSMHTASAARGRGVATRMVAHLVEEARRRGFRRISLETGSQAEFAPARALYSRAGFEICEAFEGYAPSDASTFMTLRLDQAPPSASSSANGTGLATSSWS
jgi:putative acetyltransferase